MNYAKIIADIIDKEKGYVDHPSDRGGPTNWGITEAVARANGYTEDMRDLPKSAAEAIYTKRYIEGPKFNLVAEMAPSIGLELIDTGVNMGPGAAAIFFQRLLNAFNAQGSKYPDLFVDGGLGKVTLSALRSFLNWRGEEGEAVFLKALNAVQGNRYLEIAENNKAQEDFFYGWIKNRI